MEGEIGIGGVLPPTLGLKKRKVPSEQRVHCDGFKLRAGCVPAPLRKTATYLTSQLAGDLIRELVLVGTGTLESRVWQHNRGNRGDAD
eukprot:COSAG02_NODE_15531_length_1162_cov_2.545626_2_plen_88_part_00